MRLLHPKSTEADQGAIFNCVKLRGYEDCKCWGVIITARCDLAQNKVASVNYLPIVRFTDWASRELCHQVARRTSADLRGNLVATLKSKYGVTEKLLEIFPLKEIILKECKAAERAAMTSKLEQLALLESALALNGSHCINYKEVLSTGSTHCKKITQEIISHRVADQYFLDAVDVYDTDGEGFVVLLRNVRSMSITLLRQIAVGIQADKLPNNEETSQHLHFIDPLCLITGVLRSPDVEHLMQHFANLFVRIGLEDHPKETVDFHNTLLLRA